MKTDFKSIGLNDPNLHIPHPCPYCHEVPVYNYALSASDQTRHSAIINITLACEQACLTINNKVYSDNLVIDYALLNNEIDIWNKLVDSINDEDNENPFGQYTYVSGRLRI
jgi:hypothetical protein